MSGNPNIVKKSSDERFKNGPDLCLLDFQKWAYSDMLNNAERGISAESIVAAALELEQGVRTNWNTYDLETPNGVRIEVKSSAYIQTWRQRKYAKIIFRVNLTTYWDSGKNKYAAECRRQADIYIFCIHKHKEQETIDPLNMDQWDFQCVDTEKQVYTVAKECFTRQANKSGRLGAWTPKRRIIKV